ncbi:PAS modulated sigma54 specific transcriptional regulator, Fis family [Desulfovibrio sp. X2]|uniref:sigma-54 interaction domain-containing protein n=1 Tax=Desulfovibrio sp. X2 TaxID=941449 RepID=UPI000358B100|nr:sigma 54-interacting transcriptional regulator [Desulfovibrio sp. X2]EPR41953.1 PAS modulated sigma54 specific transcriptional regulator, Fis family [Desulfovibrio sp. X2]
MEVLHPEKFSPREFPMDEYWKVIIDTIQDGVMVVAPDGRIRWVNEAFERISGYSLAELSGRSCAVLECSACVVAREKGKQDGDCHFCAMFRRGELRGQRCVLRRKDGRMLHVLKNASVLKDAAGGVRGAVETVTDVSELVDKETQIETIRRELDSEERFHGLIGRSAAMQRVFDLILDAAQSDAPVIVYGESGTGKELAARAVHEAGQRSSGPFVKVNCAALNESLLESELFGHVRGAYTGAHRDRVGRFEAAHTGDIFLDEIGDLPLSTQVKLLRVLEDKVIERVGDQRPIPVDARIISATNRDLPALIAKGSFREDFYYRINVIPIWMPPLRERAEDIPLLATSFFQRIRLRSGKAIEGVSHRAMEALLAYDWPGNVRELRSAFEYAFVSCRGAVIEPEDLPPAVVRRTPPCLVPAPGPTPGPTPGPEETGETQPAEQAEGLGDLEAIKRQRLVQALRRTGGNRSAAARLLGISRTSVWSQMKRFGLAEGTAQGTAVGKTGED